MKGLKIGQVAKEACVNIETIRYYERLKLISEPERTESGYRFFSPEVVQRIRFIKRSKDLGFTLAEIQKLLALTESVGNTCDEVKEFATLKLNEIELKIRDLQKIQSVMQDLLGKCAEGQNSVCPIIKRLQE
ncbi:mercuric resistance operon regulatory protein [Desulfosporosinus acididurans]|uniref:Mercuric resistance operon regulatory protein n=1 Tax=Desulfosporosinus acididurans TaxID=476652 RepID=A0A0J1FQI9_9FIRM|nr:MerR family DNA-binding protein [Desulfosporosinus acididurans]KLU65759.1 mercuric resistance operon regulatory protein [Desulfosporosinus acididurans]